MCIVFIEKAFVMKIIFLFKIVAGGLLCCQSQLCSGKNVPKLIFAGETEQQDTNSYEINTPR